MKSKDSLDLISRFRKKIYFQFLAALFLATVSFVLHILLDLDNTFFHKAATVLTITLVVAAFYLFERKSELFQILRGDNNEMVSEFESYLAEIDQRQKKRNLTRLVTLLILTLSMIYFFIFIPNSTWTSFLASVWLAFVLLMIGMKWQSMNDHFMMQDLKRSLRVDHSDISE